MAPQRLAILVCDLSIGGAQRRTVTLANAFAERGHPVDLLLVRSRHELLPELSDRVRTLPMGSGSSGGAERRKRRDQMRSSIPSLAAYLVCQQPAVLLSAANHANRVAPWAWMLSGARARLVLRASNHPEASAINQVRKTRTRSRWEHFAYRRANAIVAVSEGVRDALVRASRVPDDRITTIYSPVVTPELLECAKAPVSHPWFQPGSPPVILGVGRLVRQKDFPSLIRSFARLRAEREVRLVILGEGKQRRELENLARALGVARDVQLPGAVRNPFSYMARARAFVLSSAFEGLPGALIEAMACGCPVVSTDCPSGPSEILSGGAYGPLVPVKDEVSLARAIQSVLDAPQSPDRLRSRALHFSLDASVEQYAKVLFPVATRGAWRRGIPSVEA